MTREMVITAGIGPTVDDVTMRGIASAMQTTVFKFGGIDWSGMEHRVRQPYLEKLIRKFFREKVTEAHLKMPEVPTE